MTSEAVTQPTPRSNRNTPDDIPSFETLLLEIMAVSGCGRKKARTFYAFAQVAWSGHGSHLELTALVMPTSLRLAFCRHFNWLYEEQVERPEPTQRQRYSTSWLPLSSPSN